jgi:hypothetical protein
LAAPDRVDPFERQLVGFVWRDSFRLLVRLEPDRASWPSECLHRVELVVLRREAEAELVQALSQDVRAVARAVHPAGLQLLDTRLVDGAGAARALGQVLCDEMPCWPARGSVAIVHHLSLG